MINKYILFILVGFALLSSSFIMGQNTESDATYFDQTKEYMLNADGSWSYHYQHRIKINTYYAFHNLYGEEFIVYNPLFQTLKINKSVTTMADGKQIASPANAFNEILPTFAANVPAYNHLREMVVTHTGLERGATLEFEYTLTSKKGFSSVMSGYEQLLMNSAINKLTFVINVPAGATINFEQFNIATKPIVERTANRVIYKWILSDLPAASREDFRPKEQQNRPAIVFCASNKPMDVMSVFASQDAFKCEATEQIKEFAVKTIAETDSPLVKALKLQEKVVNELNTWPIPLQIIGYRLRNLSQIWQSNGGIEAEKVMILTAMLRSLNIQAEPVTVIADRYYSKKTLNTALFERFLVKVNIPGLEPVFLSPTQTDMQNNRYVLAGKRIFSLVPGKAQSSEVLKNNTNMLSLLGNLTLSSDLNISGNLKAEFLGRMNPWLKLEKDTSYVNAMLSGTLGKGKITNLVKGNADPDFSSFNFSVSAPAYISQKANYLFLKFPVLSAGSESWHMKELNSKRNEAFEIPYHLTESYDLYFTLPENYALATDPLSVNVTNEFGAIEISISSEGNQLHMVRKLTISNTFVSIEKYDTFRTFINLWNNTKYREVVLIRS